MSFTEEKKEKGSAFESLSPEETQLADEIKQLIIQLKDEITKTKLRISYQIGEKINQFYNKEYGKGNFSLLAEQAGINKETLYKYCQVASELTDQDINLLSDGGSFPLAFKHVKANLKYGREKIIEIFSQSKTLEEFKKAFKKLRAEELGKPEVPREGPTSEIVDEPGNNKKVNGDSRGQATINENRLQGTNLFPSGQSQSPDPGNKPPQDGDEKKEEKGNEGDKPKPGDAPKAEKVASTQCDDPKPDDKIPADDKRGPKPSKDTEIKKNAGCTVQINKPESEEVKTPSQSLIDGHEEPGQPVDMVPIAQSELDSLQKENEDLKAEIVDLKQEISELREEIEDLNYRLSEVNENELELEF
jgi:hypothetical protein